MKDKKPKQNKVSSVKEKHKRVVRKMVENGGNASKAIRDAGYSEAYAKNPQKILGTASMQELLQEVFPDNDLANLHRELLASATIERYKFPAKEKKETIQLVVESVPGCKLLYVRKGDKYEGQIAYVMIPDLKERREALDMAYKIHGSYKPEKIEVTDPLRKLSDEELMAEKKKLIAAMKKG